MSARSCAGTARCASHGRLARRDLVDRTQRAREMAQEADRLKFGLGEIDAVDPRPGEDDALVDDIRRLSELDALREAAQAARSALSGALDDAAADADAASAAHEVGQAKSALEATDDTALRALGERLAEALAVIGDVSTELGHYLSRIAQRCQHFGDQAGAAGRAAQPDPQVRRRHRRRAGMGARVAGAAGAAGRLRGDPGRPGAPGRGAGSRSRRRRNRTQQGCAPRPPRAWPRP